MRGSRTKALRRERGVPHPGRKHGGVSSWQRLDSRPEPKGFDHATERRSVKRRPTAVIERAVGRALRRIGRIGR